MFRRRRRNHAATLANIRRLELELGLRDRDQGDYADGTLSGVLKSYYMERAWRDFDTRQEEKLGTHH